MPRLIAFAICFFWMAAHLLASLAALGLAPAGYLAMSPMGQTGALAGLALAAAHGTVAAGFLWAFGAVILDEGAVPDEIGFAVNAAFGGAILLAAASLLLMPVTADGGSAHVLFVQLAALGATYAAVHAETASGKPVRGIEPADVAQRMALGAAHTSMLEALSGRGGTGEERL
ncbi:hypothetical protein ACLB6G_06455 [Zhengella sp. ZM62]|uniref:hypothetical protein n=1 Tax=Zhengella sedimenti TaxID=3390035 RepID=UPI0039758B6C